MQKLTIVSRIVTIAIWKTILQKMSLKPSHREYAVWLMQVQIELKEPKPEKKKIIMNHHAENTISRSTSRIFPVLKEGL